MNEREELMKVAATIRRAYGVIARHVRRYPAASEADAQARREALGMLKALTEERRKRKAAVDE